MTTSADLFAGVGGLGMAVDAVFGTTPAWFAEIAPEPSRVLAHRHPDVPNLGDVARITDPGLRVDVLAGGFPCQDVSLAGRRRGMHPGTRSGLWAEFARLIDLFRPSWVVIENVRGLLSAEAAGGDLEPCPWCVGDRSGEPALRALGAVLGDLAELGFDAEWTGLPASAVGAPHGRFRIFILAWPTENTRGGGGWGRTPEPEPARLPDPAIRPDPRGDTGRADRPLTLLPTPMVGSTSEAAHGQISGQYRAAMDAALSQVTSPTDWGPYAWAIQRWELVLGRPAPSPVVLDRRGVARLNPELTEWMMGWPQGYVTAPELGLGRNAQLKVCGNGVVPQQAAEAIRQLLSRPGVPSLAVAA